jgi:hypothetical protein
MADQIDPRDPRARARQATSEKPMTAPGVEDAPTFDGLESLEEELVGVAASEDGVFLPVGGWSLPLDSSPGLAGLAGVDTAQSARQVLAHDRSGVHVTRTGRGLRQLMGIGVLVLAAVLDGCSPSPRPEPDQPIAYNHQVHVQDQEMECTRCHLGAETQDHAGLPPMTVCAGCHRRQGTDIPAVQAFMELYDGGQGQPLAWNKVNVIPESAMVHFKHKPHARAGVECATCHGDIGSMTVAHQVINVANMGWCVECHRENEAPTDCLACHH